MRSCIIRPTPGSHWHCVVSCSVIVTTSDPSSSFPPPGRTNPGDLASGGMSSSFSDYDLRNIKQSITKRLVRDEKAGQGSDPVAQEKQQLGRTTSTTSNLGTTKPRRKNLSVGSEPHPMDMVFDQDTYAPDGSLRTVHMLPDPKESFEEAKKARYLRWRGPREGDVELTVNEIFAKDETTIRANESI